MQDAQGWYPHPVGPSSSADYLEDALDFLARMRLAPPEARHAAELLRRPRQARAFCALQDQAKRAWLHRELQLAGQPGAAATPPQLEERCNGGAGLEAPADLPGMPPDIRRYTMEEVSLATGNFSRFVDEDGLRPAFHGEFPPSGDWRGLGTDTHGAIVRLLPLPEDEAVLMQSKREFVARVLALTRLSHPDVLNFTGYAYEDGCFVAVFEPAEQTLFQRLHFPEPESASRGPLTWKERMRVVLGVAEALSLMHTCGTPAAPPSDSPSGAGSPVPAGPLARATDVRPSYPSPGTPAHDPARAQSPRRLRRRKGEAPGFSPSGPFVHGAVKSCNVLLTPERKPKLFDALVPRRPEEEPLRSVSLHGSFGYLDPNYADTRTLGAPSDVYSFGVLLLEVVSGRAALDGDAVALIVSAQEFFVRKEEYVRLLDPALSDSREEGEVPVHELVAIVDIAQSCTQVQEELRPTMPQVREQVRAALLTQA